MLLVVSVKAQSWIHLPAAVQHVCMCVRVWMCVCIHRTWNSLMWRWGGGVDVQLRHENQRIRLQDHNITAESILQHCTTAQHAHYCQLQELYAQPACLMWVCRDSTRGSVCTHLTSLKNVWNTIFNPPYHFAFWIYMKLPFFALLFCSFSCKFILDTMTPFCFSVLLLYRNVKLQLILICFAIKQLYRPVL